MKFQVHPHFLLALGAALIATTVVAAANEVLVEGTVFTRGLSKTHYVKMAKISASRAEELAKKEVSGRIVSNKLESEDGFLVYAVELLEANGERQEILVDAGSGKILPGDQDSESSEKDDD